MGAQNSSLSDLPKNEQLIRLVSDKKIDRDDKFWDDFLMFKFSMPINKSDSRLLKEAVESLCESIGQNNKLSGNFTTLACIGIFYIREMVTSTETLKDQTLITKCHNTLFIMRCCCEYFAENYTANQLVGHFNTLPSFNGQPTIFEEFLLVLSELIAYIPVDSRTYFMHLEAVTLYLVFLGTRVYETAIDDKNKIYLMIMNSRCSVNATSVVRKLLHNYIKNEDIPSPQQSIVGWATSGIWSLFGGSTVQQQAEVADTLKPLACHSLLLLLIFSFHFTEEKNQYRAAMFQFKPGNRTEPDVPSKDRSFPLNFKRLYTALERDLSNDRSVLLLYLLLHKNPSFLKFTLNQKDLQNMILPILEVLYHAEQKNAHHIYMALIVVLMFSQEEKFNSVVHDMPIPDIAWYKERNITGISAGSLLVLIVLRTIQYNMARMRDKYLHTNCLASLANMASTFKSLHCTVTQKLISLFNQLLKKHTKLSSKIKAQQIAEEEDLSDLAVVEEILSMMMEILNACLCQNLQENSNLVYALLRNKELFHTIQSNPRFQDIVHNIDTILTYFAARVDEQEHLADTPEQIIDLIKASSATYPQDQMKKFAQLKFKYMEEEAAEEFFVPYIWSIIYKSSFLFWKSERITLFCIQQT